MMIPSRRVLVETEAGDLSEHGFRYHDGIGNPPEKIETVDPGKQDQWRSVDDYAISHAQGPRRDPPRSPGKPRLRWPKARR